MLDKLSAAGISGLRWMVGGPMEDQHRREDGFEHELDVNPRQETVIAWAERMEQDFQRSGARSEVFHGLEEGASTRRLLEEAVAGDRGGAADGVDVATQGYMFGLALGLAVKRTATTEVVEPASVVKETAVRIRQHDDVHVPNQFVLAMYEGANDLP